jgi:hypothetical protein
VVLLPSNNPSVILRGGYDLLIEFCRQEDTFIHNILSSPANTAIGTGGSIRFSTNTAGSLLLTGTGGAYPKPAFRPDNRASWSVLYRIARTSVRRSCPGDWHLWDWHLRYRYLARAKWFHITPVCVSFGRTGGGGGSRRPYLRAPLIGVRLVSSVTLIGGLFIQSRRMVAMVGQFRPSAKGEKRQLLRPQGASLRFYHGVPPSTCTACR